MSVLFERDLVQERVEIIGYLNHCGVRVFGQDEIDRHPGHASVMGNQSPGDSDRVQCYIFDSLQVGVAQRLRVLDERRDNQVVAECLAMGIIGKGVDAIGIRRAPRGFGQLLYRTKRLAGEHRALPGCDGNQRRMGYGVGIFQGVESGKLRIAFVEQAAVIVRDADEAGAPGHSQH